MIIHKTAKFLLGISLLLSASKLFAEQNQITDDNKEIEQITVTGADQLSVLRYAMYRAEEDFFNSFNELTTNKDFKITCKKEPKHAFTRILERQCKSAFESDVAFELTQRAIRNGGIEKSPMKGEIYVAQERVRRKQIAEMEKLLLENPEMQQKLIKLNQAKAIFAEANQAK